MSRVSLFICLLACLCTSLKAQSSLDFDKLSIEDGFTSSKANTIIQDQKGFVWIGTWNGLNRYDGYHCEIFRPVYHDSTTISNREVVKLLEDRKGNIWIGTSSGLNCMDPSTLKIKRFPFENRIIALLEDHEGVIWVGTWNGGLFSLDPKTGETKNYFENEIISDIFLDSRNNLWLASYYGLINFDRNTSSYYRFLPDDRNPQNSISHSVVTQVVEGKDGVLWVGTWGGGLNKVLVHPDKDQISFIHYRSIEKAGSISSDVVYRLHYDRYGNLWAGTWNHGLNLLTIDQQQMLPEKAIFKVYQNDLSDPYSLSGNNISALFVDRSGILWVGSSSIDRTNILKTGIARYKTNRLEKGNYVDCIVRSFIGHNDYMWVGTSNQIMLFRLVDDQYLPEKDIEKIHYIHNGYQYVSNSVLSMTESPDGFWVGTEDAGLVFFKGQSAITEKRPNFTYYNRETNPSLPGDKVSNLFQSKKYPGVIWIGTMQSGFAKLTYNKGQTTIESFQAGKNDDFCSDNNIRCVLEDKHGLVWIGTQNGLNCFDPETRKFKKYFYSLPDTSSINDNVINAIYEDSSGGLWIGTNAGLNKKEDRILENGQRDYYFKGFPGVVHLNGEIVLNILEDRSGKLWLVLYRGVVQFDELSESIVNEYLTKEFQNVRVERGAAFRSTNGNLLMGGGNGFIAFNPDSLFKYSFPPEVCLTDLMISNQSISDIDRKTNRFRLDQAVPYCKSIRLSHKDRVITLVFSAFDFKNPSKNTYSYLLEGFDREWNEVGSRNTATYTNIPHGKYTFKVKAANSEGIWGKECELIEIVMAPPWWKSVWAYIFYFMLVMGLLYFFKEYSIIQVREKGRLLIERMQKEEAQKLDEMKSRFFTDITHEFRTPLTLIMGPAQELSKAKGQSPFNLKQAELIERNAQKLLRLVNQLMEFRKVEKGKMEFYLQKVDMARMLNELFELFKPMSDSQNIEFSLHLQSSEMPVIVDADKYEKILYNLVSNAFKYTENGGKITIRATIEKQEDMPMLVVEVEDTGIGISAENKGKVFERFFQAHQKRTQSTGGIGLYLTRAFVEQHKGRIELDSEPGKGSCFKVIVPAGDLQFVSTGEQQIMQNEVVDALPEPQSVQENWQEANEKTTNTRLPHILIVEDDNDLNQFIASGLQQSFKVIACFNGREGLDQARKQNPDIIISDIMMPEMDGYEMCRQLRKDLNTSHIPVIFLTAKTMHEDEIKGLKIGAVDYINKPFSLVSLTLKIQNILGNLKNVYDKMRADQILEPENIELSSLDEAFLKEAVDTVNRFMDDATFDVERFSHEMGISSNQAYRKIKALTGQTAKEFIRNQRLKTAAGMFLQKRRSISEIIFMVGFSSPSYFARCFKEYYGCTPKEYIERNAGRAEKS